MLIFSSVVFYEFFLLFILSVCKASSQENIPEESAKKKMIKKMKISTILIINSFFI